MNHESEIVKSAIESIRDYIKEFSPNDESLKSEIHNRCVSISASSPLKMYITFNSIFTLNILNEFPKYTSFLKSLSTDPSFASNFLQTTVHFFTSTYPDLEKAIPSFLKYAYDADLLEEQQLLDWEDKKFKTDKKSCLYNKKAEKKFKKKAEQFFNWLREAEEAESEEDESEEEKREVTEEDIKKQKMKELIEKEKLKQQKDLEEGKKQQVQKEEDTAQGNNEDVGKIDVLKVEVDEDEDDIDIDDI